MSKRVISVLAIFAALALGISLCADSLLASDGIKTRKTGRDELVKLWDEYESAAKADRPKQVISVLTRLKAYSLENRCDYDYYRAARLYCDYSVSVNWKLRDSLYSDLDSLVNAYGSAVMSFYHKYSAANASTFRQQADFINKNRSELKSKCSSSFHTTDQNIKSSPLVSTLIADKFTDDYTYALWSAYLDGNTLISDILKSDCAHTYPDVAILEYLELCRESDRAKLTNARNLFLERYSQKAASLLVRQDMLCERLNAESSSEKVCDNAYYLQLKADCEQFVRDAAKFRGEEASMADYCTQVKGILTELNDVDLRFSIENSKASFLMRNLDEFDFILMKDGKETFRSKIKNPYCSYYAVDTVKFAIPQTLADGDYDVVCRKARFERYSEYNRHSLSVAIDTSPAGSRIYVADYMSGKPVKAVNLSLRNFNGDVTAEVKNFVLSGFTSLPEEIAKYINKKSNYLLCTSEEDGRHRESMLTYIPSYYNYEFESSTYGSILTDCPVYKPGSQLKLKGIFYRNTAQDVFSVVPEGTNVSLNIYDPEGKLFYQNSFKANNFGSVSASVFLPEGVKGGNWSVCAKCDGESFRSNFTVDELVLPTYELTFLPSDEICIAGETMRVKAKLSSLSAQPMSGARIYWYAGNESGEVAADKDGSLEIAFTAVRTRYYSPSLLKIKVVALSGESQEFRYPYYALDKFDLRLELDQYQSSSPELSFKLGVGSQNARVPVDYILYREGRIVGKGSGFSSETVKLELDQYDKAVEYELKAYAKHIAESGREYSDSLTKSFFYVPLNARALDVEIPLFHRKIASDNISYQFGDSSREAWVVAELWGANSTLLRSELLYVDGQKSSDKSLVTINWDYKESYPDKLQLRIFGFRDATQINISQIYERPKQKKELPLSISRFENRSLPGTRVEVELNSLPDVECAVTLYDKACENFASANWNIHIPEYDELRMPAMNVDCGADECFSYFRNVPIRYATTKTTSRLNSARPTATDFDAVLSDEENSMLVKSDAVIPQQEVRVRTEFRDALYFAPCLRSDSRGKIKFAFSTGDKLSTFVFRALAHNKNMDNSCLRDELVVTMPFSLSVNEPEYLYSGDEFTLSAVLASVCDYQLSGNYKLELYPCGNYRDTESTPALLTYNQEVSGLEPYSEKKLDYTFTVPESVDSIAFKLQFVGSASDAIFFAVPVLDNHQTLCESHSAVLHSSQNPEDVYAALSSSFTATSPYGAECKVISISDMLEDAMPELQKPESDNVLALMDAYYVNAFLKSDESQQCELWAKILECQNPDGGFAWFSGFTSSPLITASVLGKINSLCTKGLMMRPESVKSACAYLDKSVFGKKNAMPWWRGGLALSQYLNIRTAFADIPLAVCPDKSEREYIKDILFPSRRTAHVYGQSSDILKIATRLNTLKNLESAQAYRKFISDLGIKCSAERKIRKAIKADYISLYEYAQPHRDGAVYFPNAVMPFRGLMESEAYAHSLICNLFASAPSYLEGRERYAQIADKLRLWLMLQKETQYWDADPAYLDALVCISEGSKELLDTKIVTMTKSFRKQFSDIRQAGNGMSISVTYIKAGIDGKRKQLSDGDSLNVGDRIIASYSIWNAENRSFVRITAPRHACMRPVNQLSSRNGNRYRWVKSASTEYWFESFPEEKTILEEELFVVRSGVFQCPVPQIESLYAPHYRANAESVSTFSVER